MASIKEFQEQFLTEKDASPEDILSPGAHLLLVFKQYRHHKKLSVELYEASLTLDGRIKNPLQAINPLDAILKTKQEQETKFFAAVARFQNNPTTPKSAMDINALREIIKNPLQLKCYIHNRNFSESVTAGSLEEVQLSKTAANLTLTVSENANGYLITAATNIHSLRDLEIKFEYFVLKDNHIHLLANLQFVKLAAYFKKHPAGVALSKEKYPEFQRVILQPLEEQVPIQYTHLPHAGQQTQTKLERIIYLTDLGRHIAINPVLRYGEAEIPILTKRNLYINDAEGRPCIFPRNEEAETGFTSLLLRQYPEFEEQLDLDLTYFYLPKKEFLDNQFFLTAFEQWRDLGITVYGFNQIKDNRLNAYRPQLSVLVTSGLNWFNIDLSVRYGKQRASLKQLERAVRNKRKYVELVDGTHGLLPADWLERLQQYFDEADIKDEKLVIPKAGYSTIKNLFEQQELDEVAQADIARYEKQFQSRELVLDKVPAGLHATLRPYQQQGLAWLNMLDAHGFGGCLADDMGLGKTIQVLAFVLLQREKGIQNTNLVVVPTSLVFNWQAEVNKFAPSISLLTYTGTDRLKYIPGFHRYEIVLTTYGTLLYDINSLKDYPFNYIFLDESQQIKNIESQRYQAVRLLQGRNRITITGTPIENNSFDLYAQLSFSCPGLLGSRQRFRDLFSVPVDKFKNSKRARELADKIAPFILRRTKQEVARELPAKTEMVLYCPMKDEQRAAYEACEKEVRALIMGLDQEGIGKSAIHILRGLTRLRQVCNSPLLLRDGQVQTDESSKLAVLMEQIENLAPNHKILVFSQFVSMLELIQPQLAARHTGYVTLTGSTSNREQVVDQFQNDASVRVFLISLKAGGSGLNLTEASYVYLVDPWWNPAVENQAIDRAYRIGQQKAVTALRLICPDTIEEKIQKLQRHKTDLLNDLLQPEDAFIHSLSKEEWLSLLDNEPENPAL